MANLTPRSPARLSDMSIGTVTLNEPPMGAIWAVMPYPGSKDALASLMTSTLGMSFPAPGESHTNGDAMVAWSGQDQAFLVGAAPDAALAAHAGLSDQSDAWARLHLSGDDAAEVLARLVPVDLSHDACPVGRALRTSLGHMSALIVRTGPDAFDLFCFRSMAGTMVHELERAMKMLAARRAL